jgi:HAD superfamily hydrolase (TIGR01549 family)
VTGSLSAGVLFDVDGTLFDTNYLHALAWSRALRDAGEWAPMNAIHRLIGMGGDQVVQELLGHESPAAVAARPRRYKELTDDVRPFPGAAALLSRVHNSGIRVVLATSASADELEELLEKLDIGSVIDAITTADDIDRSKPSPEVFLTAIERGSIDPELAIAIGDSTWDVQAARDAGIGCIAVESGGYSQHELSEAGALRVYRDVREILCQFRTSPLEALVKPIAN